MGIEVFSKNIKALREAKGLSTRAMGEEIGVSHVAISYYENCKREPTLSVMEAYSKYFNVSIDYLIGLSNERK
jgi:repressor LexA